jgi:outer membrane lipoprotein-sorting protein
VLHVPRVYRRIFWFFGECEIRPKSGIDNGRMAAHDRSTARHTPEEPSPDDGTFFYGARNERGHTAVESVDSARQRVARYTSTSAGPHNRTIEFRKTPLSPMKSLLIMIMVLLAPLASAKNSVVPAAEKWTLDTLLDQRAQIREHRALFTELKKSALDGSTRSRSGELSFEAPDRLERETSRPFFERFVVDGERVTLDTEAEPGRHKRREMALKDFPATKPALVGVRAVLSGDLATLQRHFDTDFNGTEDEWRLSLTPKDAAYSRYLRKIVMSGKGTGILVIETRARNGDFTRTLLTSNLASLD